MMRSMRNLAVGLALIVPALAAAQPSPDRWAAEIERFQTEDRASQMHDGGVVFVGSSSIRFWNTLHDDFPHLHALNRGFGGSYLSDVRHFLDELVLKHEPRAIVLYAGENDLAGDRTPEDVFADYRAIASRVRSELPETELIWISVKPGPARWDSVDKVRATNALVMEYAARDPKLEYVDVFTPMLTADLEPRGELFVEDGIHLNPEGYELWTRLVEPYVRPYTHR